MSMSFFLERGVGACASRVKVYRISRSPDASSARIVPDTIALVEFCEGDDGEGKPFSGEFL
jgi:hypothetical protein